MKIDTDERLKSVVKALQILESFSIDDPELTASELGKKLSIPKVSIYRFLKVLMKRGYIAQNAQTKKFHLGIKMFELGSIVFRNLELRKAAFPYIEELSKGSGETVCLGVLNDQKVVSIEGAESDHSLRASLIIGKSVYIHSTALGKAILSFLPEEEVNKIILEKGLPRFTNNTISDPGHLKEEILVIRKRGYSVDKEENEPGVRCVAAPIFDSNGTVHASISISGPSVRISEERIPEFSKMVISTSQKISKSLGYGLF